MSNNQDQNITFFLDESPETLNNSDIDFYLNSILEEIEDVDLYNELKLPQLLNYQENFTIKELMLICEYYGFAKELKSKKYNKEEIAHFLVEYELNLCNTEIVSRRKSMWFYINELKNDKFMKKYILWS